MNNILRDVLIICRMNIVCKLFCKGQSDFQSTRFVVLIEALNEEKDASRFDLSSSGLDLVALSGYSSFQFIRRLPSTMKNAAKPSAMIVLVRAWAGCA